MLIILCNSKRQNVFLTVLLKEPIETIVTKLITTKHIKTYFIITKLIKLQNLSGNITYQLQNVSNYKKYQNQNLSMKFINLKFQIMEMFQQFVFKYAIIFVRYCPPFYR